MSEHRKRYAQVGIGGRSEMFTNAIVGPHKDHAELVGFCDTNQGRMDLRNRQIADRHAPVKTYPAADFDRMIAENRPDTIIVTTTCGTHAQYICRAMELGCDVVTEKAMTVDDASTRRILQTAHGTGRKLQVTFNYRYAPPRSQVREIIASGAIGEVLSVDFCWLLDTRHGADYFRRWHRRRENSGSLLVHKATHHFDLVNWWIDDDPQEVLAHGSLRYYTPARADELGLTKRAGRCLNCPEKTRCPFYLDLAGNPGLKELYLDNEKYDGYFRDQCVFGGRCDIWDSMSLSVRYRRGAILSYMLHAYSPWEGYRIGFNGTKGRLEHHACENTYINGDGTVPGELNGYNVGITLIEEFTKAAAVEVRTSAGGHGGGDDPLLADVFSPNPPADPLKRKASQRAGAMSTLIGIAGCRSIDTGKAVRIDDLLQGAPLGE